MIKHFRTIMQSNYHYLPRRYMNSFDQIKAGEFKRTPTDFRGRIGDEKFPLEAGRYVLYASLACPWAHRCLITRALKGLQNAVDIVVVNPVWGVVDPKTAKQSWVFRDEVLDGFDTKDRLFSASSMKDIYEIHDKNYQGRYTVPVLFDTKNKVIVNNESSEILKIFDEDFQSLARNPDYKLRPKSVDKAEIEFWNDRMYESFNNGVYKAGFAQSQEAHEAGQKLVFDYLTEVDAVLQNRNFLCGDVFTEADIRMFVTAVRFDNVYHTHFKCSWKRLSDYKNTERWMHSAWNEMKRIIGADADPSLTSLLCMSEDHIKQHYYRSHPLINPFGIVPVTMPLGLN